ncbi:MAG: hypothetical protein JXA82_19850 [Sedimentisphaerales bacterium]|nr:hypothetical protein [Sedimentisphaerales bacterium]
MSIRQDMIWTAVQAQDHLGDSIRAVRQFLSTQADPLGGFHDRQGRPDMYYTVFGLEAALACGAGIDLDLVAEFLKLFEDGRMFDFVHLAAMARCWASVEQSPSVEMVDSLLTRIEAHRSPDGGYNDHAGAQVGSTYANFLAVGVYQDMERAMPRPEGVLQSLGLLKRDDGGYVVQAGAEYGAAPATAAAIMTLKGLGRDCESETIQWLMRQCKAIGGFVAAPLAPVPDLLSTAVSLFALTQAGVDINPIRQRCVEYIESLWDAGGGFCANWLDETVDCEYTYYGLLALGCL